MRWSPSVAREFGAIDILVNAVGGSTIIAKSGADGRRAELSPTGRS